MFNTLKNSRQNQQATVSVIRNGRKLQLPVKMGQLPPQRADNVYTAASLQPAREKWGLHLCDLNPQLAAKLRLKFDQGLVVVGVQPGSRAEATGLHQGDIIVAVKSAHQLNGDRLAGLNGSRDKRSPAVPETAAKRQILHPSP